MKIKKILSTLLATFLACIMFLCTIPSNNNVAYADDYQSYTGDDLGCTYTKDKTTFKVWSPKAGKVQLNRYTTGSDDSSREKTKPEKIETVDMNRDNSGVWTKEITGDIKNTYYTYSVDGSETPDIYGKSTGVNGDRSMVIDLDSTDPSGWENDKRVISPNQTDSVVWEIHVKDFSYDQDSGMSDKNRGKYLAFTERGTTYKNEGNIKTGIDHLKELGITHVQILPMYDYASIDEGGSSDTFNWGYDPKNFDTPEGSYSTDPYDGNVRVKELKEMVKALHDAGIGVIMDVVYNHAYDGTGSNLSPFERTVPGYYFTAKDLSGCGNSFDTTKPMYSKFIVDSMVYWAKEYHLDGFRFDLMGIIDTNTLNNARKALNEVDPQIKMWGEPWNAIGTSPDGYGNKANVKKLDNNIAVFSDNMRDALKGNTWGGKLSNNGWLEGNGTRQAEVIAGIKAMCGDYDNVNKNIWSNQPSQVITYTSCHDNSALYDMLCWGTDKEQNGQRNDEIVSINKLDAAIVLTSQGASFMQAGEEFARSKNGDDNSYISGPDINKLDWGRLKTFSDVNDYYSGLIKIRKSFSAFRDPTYDSANKMQFLNTPSNKQIAYSLENNKSGEWSKVICLFNCDSNDASINIPSGDYVIVANDTKAGLASLGDAKGSVTLKARSAMILADKSSSESVKEKEKSTVTVMYKDEKGNTLDTITLSGDVDSSYKTEPKEIKGYELDKKPSNATGTYTKENQTVEYIYKIAEKDDEEGKNEEQKNDDEEGKNVDPIKITKITINPSSVNEGDEVSVKAEVTGGDGNTNYEFKVDRVTKKKYSSSNNFKWIPSEAGSVIITVNVKDDSGNTNSLSKTITVNQLENDQEEEKAIGKVIVKYIDDEDNSVIKQKILTGNVGDEYTSEELYINGYELMSIPSKATGKFTENTITIKYKYQKSSEEPLDEDKNEANSIDSSNISIFMIFLLDSICVFFYSIKIKHK